MKLIKPSFLIKEQENGLDGVYKQIEWAGRHCYKSHDKMTEDSASQFVQRMIKSGHFSVLEHGTVYLSIPHEAAIDTLGLDWVEGTYFINPYSSINGDGECYYITTNFRVIYENGWLDDMKYLCEPTEHHVKRITVRFICDRGILAEFTRHRLFSFAAESTRYCNYSKERHGGELTFIVPPWLDESNLNKIRNRISLDGLMDDFEVYEITFVENLEYAENCYLALIMNNWSPQQARAVLPNALKTELVMTGTTDQWESFFKLRDDEKHAHPQAYELAHPLHEEFKRRNLCV